VEKAGEPITPFLDRVRQLAALGTSSVLVLGGSGDYFDVADTVIRIERFEPRNVTGQAKAIAEAHPSQRHSEGAETWPARLTRRVPDPRSLDPRRGRREVSIKTHALRAVHYGSEEIDLSCVSQLVDEGQVRSIGSAIEMARRRFMKNGEDMPSIVTAVMQQLETHGLDSLDSRPGGDFVQIRPYELAAAINRLRSVRMLTDETIIETG